MKVIHFTLVSICLSMMSACCSLPYTSKPKISSSSKTIYNKSYTCNDFEMYGKYSSICKDNPLNYTPQKVKHCAKNLCSKNR